MEKVKYLHLLSLLNLLLKTRAPGWLSGLRPWAEVSIYLGGLSRTGLCLGSSLPLSPQINHLYNKQYRAWEGRVSAKFSRQGSHGDDHHHRGSRNFKGPHSKGWVLLRPPSRGHRIETLKRPPSPCGPRARRRQTAPRVAGHRRGAPSLSEGRAPLPGPHSLSTHAPDPSRPHPAGSKGGSGGTAAALGVRAQELRAGLPSRGRGEAGRRRISNKPGDWWVERRGAGRRSLY